MNEEFTRVEQLVSEQGFTRTAYLDCGTIALLEEVRQMCAANTCGQYGKNWACPPGCGELSECRERIAAYTWGILVQTVGELEDNMDFEAMMETEELHRKHFRQTAEKLRELYPDMLPLGAGCCTICASCTYPHDPCRFPGKRISSMESYGILVNDLCTKNNLAYYYGPDKIAYTSCYLLG